MNTIAEQAPELTRLVQASHVRHLTDAERLRLAALTWTTDATLERAAYIRATHPDVFPAMPVETAGILDAYLAKRALALEGGRQVAELAPAVTAAIDSAAAEYRATNVIPADVRNVDRVHRDRFAEVARVDGLGAETLAAWREWQDAELVAEAFIVRRQAARGALGLQTGYPDRSPRSLLREFAIAIGDEVFLDR